MSDSKAGLADTLRFLGRGSLFAFIVAVICGAVGYVVSLRMPATFTATSTVYATSRVPMSSSSLGLAFFRVDPLDADGYAFAATNRDVLLGALALLDGNQPNVRDVEQLASKIDISTDSTSSGAYVHISATASSPQGAAEIANAVALSLIRWDDNRSRSMLLQAAATIESQIQALELESLSISESAASDSARALDENLRLRVDRQNELTMLRVLAEQSTGALRSFESATPPSMASGPRIVLNTAIAAALGLIFGYALVGFHEAFRYERRQLKRVAPSRSHP